MLELLGGYLAIAGMVMWLAMVLMPWRPWSTREQLEASPCEIIKPAFNDITALIPARNESQYISQTLEALRKQGTGLEIIVIDDQSVDDTAARAKKHGARVIAGSTPPVGWSGKLWALEQGLREVRTAYTLLLDADIELMPGMLSSLRAKAQREQLALVSIMAAPPMRNFWERLLMPPFIFFFKLLYPFALANNPRSTVAAAAGGCILVETIALHRAGAFTCLHDALIDDCTLAARIKQAGMKIWVGLSHSALIHRDYDTLKTVWDMVARTAYTQLHYSPALLIVCTLIMGSMFWLAPLASVVIPGWTMLMICALTWVAMLITYFPILFYYRRSFLWVLALPFVGTLYLAMTWTSAVRYWQGERASWKDRRYESKTLN